MSISRNILKQVLLDNQKDIEKYEILYRDFDLDSFPLQVFVGVRRSGKSYLLFQKMRMMLNAGYGWEDMLYLDFEDTRLDDFTTDIDTIDAWEYSWCKFMKSINDMINRRRLND